ncbi:MAG TPA: GSCFA domain-containing protein [Ohtaekwangia sp.]
MKAFRTVVSPTASNHPINLQTKVLTIGSCFADAIGSRLIHFKSPSIANPFGVLYSPNAIHKALRYALFNEAAPQHTYLQHQDVHLNYDFHSEFSSLQKEALEKKIRKATQEVHDSLKTAEWLFITYGTAWVYERTDTGEIVANCHKQPTSAFRKSLLTQKKIIESFEALYTNLKTINPAIRVILTVSPVRHIKDTLELNSVSKSVLRLASHTLQENYTDVEYFPAYEIMMDDLRDYRFYKEDMIHPSAEAEEYIWNYFINQYGSDHFRKFITQWTSIQSAMAHKPFHPQAPAHQQFLKETLRRLEELKSTVPVDDEIASIRKQII